MNAHSMQVVGTLIAMAATFGLAPTAQAGDLAKATKHPDVIVNYGDLNIDSTQGAKVLYARLGTAAAKACGSEFGTRELARQLQYQACYDHAMDRAVEKIGKPQVQALHAARRNESRVG
jgi:UrcA family protein